MLEAGAFAFLLQLLIDQGIYNAIFPADDYVFFIGC